MGWQLFKNITVFLFIVLGFVLILLLPRDRELVVFSALHVEARYPFTMDLYKERIEDFIQYFQTEEGFGKSRTGMPYTEQVQKLLVRSLVLIIPAFFISMILGTACGILQFYYRNKKRGKFQAIISWIFTSIPDFFLYIAIQYLLIKLIRAGFPRFDIYGSENWYSFIIPLIVVTLLPFIHMTKFTAASMENEMGQEYLRTAYAKGLGDLKILFHMFWNCLSTILNQSQLVMLFILSSLPIIEKLSNYRGAGLQLLNNILDNDEVGALAFMLPFLFLMFITIILTQVIKFWLVPKAVRANI